MTPTTPIPGSIQTHAHERLKDAIRGLAIQRTWLYERTVHPDTAPNVRRDAKERLPGLTAQLNAALDALALHRALWEGGPPP